VPLDHQRPGANDNASGVRDDFEVARTLQKLISQEEKTSAEQPPHLLVNQGRLSRLQERSGLFSTGNRRDDGAAERETGSLRAHQGRGAHGHGRRRAGDEGGVPRDTRTDEFAKLVHDVAWAFAEFVNEESYKFAATGKAEYPFVAPEGSKEPLRAEYSAFTRE